MWDAIAKILTNANALLVLLFLLVFVVIFLILVKTGMVEIKTNSIRVGKDEKERRIIQQQMEWARSYLRGIEGQIKVDESKYGGYLTKYAIEVIGAEVVNWIILNNINLESDYISIKQEKILSMIRSMDVRPEFRTKEFEKKAMKWTEELIRKLVVIRHLYK